MKINRVTRKNAAAFAAYCAQYGREHDDSYLPGDTFIPAADQPAYLLYDGPEIIGAAGLLRTPPFAKAKKGRFMILHAARPDPEAYGLLARAIETHGRDLDYLYLFLPERKEQAARIVESLGYSVQRISYRLTRQLGSETAQIPAGYRLKTLDRETIEPLTVYWTLAQRNMAQIEGHVDHPIDLLLQDLQRPEYLPGGLKLLYRGDEPVGTLQISRDEEEPAAAWIDTISVHARYRRQGLGRALLRQALVFAESLGFAKINLSVNGENTGAVALYLSAGFEKNDVYICFHKML